jgi:hypothetical protein
MRSILRIVLLSLILSAAASVRGAPANDNFTNSVQITDTNFTYSGNFTDATLEPGEPCPYATNTVWMSWAAPADGYADVRMASASLPQYWAVFTGGSVDHLQPVTVVPINPSSRFLVSQGTVYYFQFSGGADNFAFSFQFQPFPPCLNDNFTNATIVRGNLVGFGPDWTVGATMELGEPAHMGPVPQKSIWWQWQAPQWAHTWVNPSSSLTTNYVIAVYTGSSVEMLSLVKKATNSVFYFPSVGGQIYYIAAAVPTNTAADISIYLQLDSPDYSTHLVPANILQEPSWEGTAVLDAQYWQWSGPLNGYVNDQGGADGTTWPELNPGTQIWQNVPTVPGHKYAIKFAFAAPSAQVQVLWEGNPIGVSTIPDAEGGFWHWDSYLALATNTTSELRFNNLGPNVSMDAFSVVDASAPPAIVTQPGSVSSVPGGTAGFVVGATGTEPLIYQWYLNNMLMPGQTNNLLLLTSLSTNDTGNYQVSITNNFGAVTSAVASLQVGDATTATILSQPCGGTIPLGGYFNLTVVASGSPPLSYQWFVGGDAIADATNKNLTFASVQLGDAGVYTVRVRNNSSTVWSLPATLNVTTSELGGGTIDFRNRMIAGVSNGVAPIFDVDGLSPLSGSNYVAQLFGGASLAALRAVGEPSAFQDAFNAGYFVPQTNTLADVPPGSNAVVQIRAWDAAFGSSYEEARQMGGRVGKSDLLQVTAGGGVMPPGSLSGLQSFSLQAGLPYFQVAVIQFVGRQPPNTLVWSLQGQAGNLYVIEKSDNYHKGSIWRPHTVVTNVTGTVTFTDTAGIGSTNFTFYRARMLD